MSNQIMRIFFDVDMRNGHNGLRALAADGKVKLEELKSGEHVVFLNRGLNRVKMASQRNVVSYLFQEKGRIDLNTLQYIAQSFDSKNRVMMSEALKKAINDRIRRKRTREI